MGRRDAESQECAAPLRWGAGGRFELQPGEQRLLVDGRPAPLGRRALSLLLALASRPDHLFTKHELLERVWPGLVVEEANLQVQVANLRKVLGGDAIATESGRGYRFVAPVVSSVSNVSTVLRPGAPGAAHTSPQPEAATDPAPHARALLPRGRSAGLFGRSHELQLLDEWLRPGACITLVGPAGVGKTTLARVVAEGCDFALWVDLASLPPGDDGVASAVARVLGASMREGDAVPQLLRALRGQRRLLVLDNAEHVVDACAALATPLCRLAELRLLVTSQVPLAVAAERVLRLQPLALPGAGGDEGLADGALGLLIDRIVAADHRFRVTPDVLPALRTLCTQLDGLPLAIEMAAARVPLIGLQAVHDALVQRFALLRHGHRGAAPRHRTLRHALDWSYQLLDAEEQRLFRALGVLSDGGTLELVVALMSDDEGARWDIVDRLAALAARSLVVVGREEPPRYRLLETMRAYAIEQLRQANATAPLGEEDQVRRRHAAAMLALLARGEVDGEGRGDLDRDNDRGSAQAQAQARCEAEMENMREAIAWAQGHDLSLAAQLTARLTPVANFTVWRQESTRWLRALEGAMSGPAGEALETTVQAAWWTEFARTAAFRRDPRCAVAAQRALGLWDQAGDPRRALFAACVCVRSIFTPGAELDRACAELEARAAAVPGLGLRERLQVNSALAAAATEREDLPAILSRRLMEADLAGQLGQTAVADAAESNVVFVLNAMGRFAEAAERGRALLERIDTRSDRAKGNLPWVLQGLLKALVAQRRLDDAQALLPRAWATCARFGVPVVAATAARLAAARGRLAPAALLAGHTAAAFAAREMAIGVVDQGILAEVEAQAAAALGAAQTQALMERGRGLSEAAAAALAAGDDAAVPG